MAVPNPPSTSCDENHLYGKVLLMKLLPLELSYALMQHAIGFSGLCSSNHQFILPLCTSPFPAFPLCPSLFSLLGSVFFSPFLLIGFECLYLLSFFASCLFYFSVLPLPQLSYHYLCLLPSSD